MRATAFTQTVRESGGSQIITIPNRILEFNKEYQFYVIHDTGKMEVEIINGRVMSDENKDREKSQTKPAPFRLF